MILPEVSTRLSEGQAVVNDESDGKVDDRIRVLGLRRSNVRCVDGGMVFAFATVMSGVSQWDINRLTGRRIAEVVQVSDIESVTAAETIAEWATAFFADVRAFFDFWSW